MISDLDGDDMCFLWDDMKTDVVIQNQKKRVHNIKILNTVPLFLNPLICLSNDLDVTSQMKMRFFKFWYAISTYFHNILYFMGEQNEYFTFSFNILFPAEKIRNMLSNLHYLLVMSLINRFGSSEMCNRFKLLIP